MAAVVLHNGQMLRLCVPFQRHLFQGFKIARSAGEDVLMAKFFVVCEVCLLQGFVGTELASKSVKGFLDEVTSNMFLPIFTGLATNAHGPQSLILVMTTYVTRNTVLVERFVVTALTSISHLLLVNGNHVRSQVLVLCSCVIAFIAFFLAFVNWRRKGIFFFCNCLFLDNIFFCNQLFLVFLDNNFSLAFICDSAALDMFFTSDAVVAANTCDFVSIR